MKNSQSGNVIFIILIAIGLFAAFAYAVARGNQSAVAALNKDRNELLSGEIIGYGDIMNKATIQLRLRGFTASQISFESPETAAHGTFDHYQNTSCTSNECLVFHPEGGGVKWKTVPRGILVPDIGQQDYGWWSISGAYSITGVGTDGCGAASDCKDLVLFLNNVNEAICLEINNLLDVENPSDLPPAAAGVVIDPMNNHFHGTYSNAAAEIVGSGNTAFHGKSGACFSHNTPVAGTYMFYYVLIPR